MSMEEPTVSVVMIFLNEERFIREAIESVLAQSFARWELLLVDDGSTDVSSAIARGYAERFPAQICYLEHPNHENRGMSASRNLGIHHARGKFVAFLDADDVWLSDALERQVQTLASHNQAGMIYGATRFWYSWTGNPEDQARDYCDFRGRRSLLLNRLVEPPELLFHFLQDGGTVPCMCSILVRRQVIKAVGGFEERFRGLYEDQAFYAKVALTTTVYATDQWWAQYRQHPDSSCATASKDGHMMEMRLHFLNWLESYLSAQGAVNTKINRILQRQRWMCRHPRLTGVIQTAAYWVKKTMR